VSTEPAYRKGPDQPAVMDWSVGDILREAATESAERLALIWPGNEEQGSPSRSWTFAELLDSSEAVARALLGRFEPGERVAVWAPNIPEWLLLQFGCALAGLTLVTVNPAYRPKELGYVLGQSRSSGVFLVPEHRGSPMAAFMDQVRPTLPELREIISFAEWDDFVATGSATQRLPVVTPDDPAQIQYTSGTTGFPKGAVLHHRGIANNALAVAQRYEVTPGERWLNFMPLFHVAGCTISALGALQARATQVLMPFEPGRALSLIERERCSLFIGGATMFTLLLEHPRFRASDLSSLRAVGAGGMVAPPEMVRTIESTLGIPFGIMFGLTEACGIATQVSLHDDSVDRAETIGRPHPNVEVKIVDPADGRTLPAGVIGEICVRGYLVMSGYFEMPEATAAAIDADGWLHTGDLGSMDERGFCRIEGRVKEMINRGAEKISPREIEELLLSHPAVAAVAVVGIPDPKWGEVVAAFIRPAEGEAPSEQELFAFCRRHLAPYKTPKHWVFVEEFPLTPAGKIQKFVLRDRFVASAPGGPERPALVQG
jgi:fatty-acyl-CoA synthase